MKEIKISLVLLFVSTFSSSCKEKKENFNKLGGANIFSPQNTGVEDSDESWIRIVQKRKNYNLYKYSPIDKKGVNYKKIKFNKKNLSKNKKKFLFNAGTYNSGLLGEAKNYKIGSFNVIEIDSPNKKNDNDNEVTIVMIHGSGGFQIVFADLLKGVSNRNFNGNVNIMVGKRYNSNCVKLVDQKNEIKKQIFAYFKTKNKRHRLIFCGTSSGAILCLMLLNEFIEKYKKSYDVKSVILTSGGLGGINAIENYLNNLGKKVPFFVKHLELSVFNCEFKDNPPGIVDIRRENIINCIRKSNKYLKTENIKLLNVKGYKPCNMEYESLKNIRKMSKLIFNMIKKKICEFLKKLSNPVQCNIQTKEKKKKLTCAEKIKRLKIALKEVTQMIKMKLSNLYHSPFSTCKMTGDKHNDMIFSVKNQSWPYKNKNVEEILLPKIVHTKFLLDVIDEGTFGGSHATFQDPILHNKFKEYIDDALR